MVAIERPRGQPPAWRRIGQVIGGLLTVHSGLVCMFLLGAACGRLTTLLPGLWSMVAAFGFLLVSVAVLIAQARAR